MGRVWAGIIILGIGTVLLAGKLGLDWLFPHWLFNWHNMWPLILIVVGLVIGGNSNFRNPVSYILLGLGSFFLIRNTIHFDIGAFIWPAVIIGIGLWLLLGREKGGPCPPKPDRRQDLHGRKGDFEWDKRIKDEPAPPQPGEATTFNKADDFEKAGAVSDKHMDDTDGGELTDNDFLKSTSIFSDVKKMVSSKRFQGGEIVNVFGGTDIDLIQADIQRPIVIDVFQLFAGTKIIVPAHWKIHSEVVSVFGEVNDRRFSRGMPYEDRDDQKVVYIKGTSIFGGITIKNI